MLVSLNKNAWLNVWIREKFCPSHANANDNMLFDLQGFRDMRKRLSDILNREGYTSKVTSTNDMIISIPDEEYVYLKLKYC